jgi:hypothetical protein
LRDLATLRLHNTRLQHEIFELREELARLRPKPSVLTIEQFVERHAARITEWEQNFLHSVADRGRSLSPKQLAVVDRIEAKVGERIPLPPQCRPFSPY